jgi:mannose-6-phosphate isomerase-like protein (cupin superfamily)
MDTMGATRTAAAVRDRGDAERALAAEGCSAPRPWGNAPGDSYGRHEHGYHKVLFCLEGSITFHLDDRDVTLARGDRLDLEPGTPHAATVGREGCSCIEGSR